MICAYWKCFPELVDICWSAHAFIFHGIRRSLRYLRREETRCPEARSDRAKKKRMFELYGVNKDGIVYRSPPPRRKEVDILEVVGGNRITYSVFFVVFLPIRVIKTPAYTEACLPTKLSLRLQTCLQLSSPELMRKLPNGDAVHHAKDTDVSTSFDKDKGPPRENGMLRKPEEDKSNFVINFCGPLNFVFAYDRLSIRT